MREPIYDDCINTGRHPSSSTKTKYRNARADRYQDTSTRIDLPPCLFPRPHCLLSPAAEQLEYVCDTTYPSPGCLCLPQTMLLNPAPFGHDPDGWSTYIGGNIQAL